MDLNEASFKENKIGRETAQTLIQMAEEYAAQLSSKAKARFWEVIEEAAHKHLPKKEANCQPMTDKECRMFGDEEMTYGQHKGKLIEEVPLDYLAWLSDEKFREARQIKRYLTSAMVKEGRR